MSGKLPSRARFWCDLLAFLLLTAMLLPGIILGSVIGKALQPDPVTIVFCDVRDAHNLTCAKPRSVEVGR